ncbi:hypothetical protein PG996_010610 [Apiospora saccharicola]|uniref:Uncharacterized protein n=1 Tax=Apiospora saccharicola TaxID=335842 RepID=A0ABR1URK4_9PEZI
MATPTAQRQQRPGTRLSRWMTRKSAASKDLVELISIIIALLAISSHHGPDSSTIISRSLFLLLKLFSWIMRRYTLGLHHPLDMLYKPSTESQIGDWNPVSLLAVCGFAIYQPGAEAEADADVTNEAEPEAKPEDEPRDEPGAEAEPRPQAMAEAEADVQVGTGASQAHPLHLPAANQGPAQVAGIVVEMGDPPPGYGDDEVGIEVEGLGLQPGSIEA